MKVPFNKPVKLSNHEQLVLEVIERGELVGNGSEVVRSEKWLEERTKVPARLVTSATHALEMMALLAEIRPGDEVIVPSFTFVSTANAFALRGAVIRFADNDEYGNILPSEVERLYTKKTKAVVAVHYGGNSCDMDLLKEICDAKNIFLFEDAAQSIGVTYKGVWLGAYGDLGCYSFHETKNITSGEGGALFMRNEKFVERAEILREKGTNRRQFLQGAVDKYTWVDLGSSYVLSNLNAAYLYPQLIKIEEVHQKRKKIWTTYKNELEGYFVKKGARVLQTPSYNTPNYHLFGVVFDNPSHRTQFIAFMKEKQISCPFHYVSLHSSPFGRTFAKDGKVENLPGADQLSACLVRLPLYYNMTEDELSFVVSSARQFLT